MHRSLDGVLYNITDEHEEDRNESGLRGSSHIIDTAPRHEHQNENPSCDAPEAQHRNQQDFNFEPTISNNQGPRKAVKSQSQSAASLEQPSVYGAINDTDPDSRDAYEKALPLSSQMPADQTSRNLGSTLPMGIPLQTLSSSYIVYSDRTTVGNQNKVGSACVNSPDSEHSAQTTRTFVDGTKAFVDTWLCSMDGGENLPSASEVDNRPITRQDLSRASSVESLESHTSCTVASVSSCSSLASQNNRPERLITLLLKDEQLKSLYAVAARKVSADKFQENFRRCLIQCSIHLKAEAALKPTTSRTQSLQCAKAVRLYSRQAATQVRSTLETKDIQTHTEDYIDSDSLNSDDLESDDGLPDITIRTKTNNDRADDLEAVLISSIAFQLLIENFPLFLQPDPIRKALFALWPTSHPRKIALEIQYHVSWLLPTFMKSEFPAAQRLKNVLTLSGQMTDAQAQSCGEYVAAIWPEFGDLLLQAIQDLIQGVSNSKLNRALLLFAKSYRLTVETSNEDVVIKVCALEPMNEHSLVYFTVTAVHAMHEKIASAISWFAAALRPSAHPHVTSSSVTIEAGKSGSEERKIQIRLNDLEEIPSGKYCWHALFPHAVIAKTFPIRDRLRGKGLEISFPNMASMAQSTNLVECGGRLVAEGLKWYLIPSNLLPGDGVQWHLDFKRQEGTVPRNKTLFEVLRQKHLSNRFKSLDIDYLVESRCFLGWAEEVEVVIGSESFAKKQLGWSMASKCPEVGHGYCHLRSHLISRGFRSMDIAGYINPGYTMSINDTSRQTWNRCSGISATMDDDSKANTLMYDIKIQTAFLLPKADVVLFLAHKIITQRRYQLFVDHQETTLPYASSSVETTEILQESLYYSVCRRGSRSNVGRSWVHLVTSEPFVPILFC